MAAVLGVIHSVRQHRPAHDGGRCKHDGAKPGDDEYQRNLIKRCQIERDAREAAAKRPPQIGASLAQPFGHRGHQHNADEIERGNAHHEQRHQVFARHIVSEVIDDSRRAHRKRHHAHPECKDQQCQRPAARLQRAQRLRQTRHLFMRKCAFAGGGKRNGQQHTGQRAIDGNRALKTRSPAAEHLNQWQRGRCHQQSAQHGKRHPVGGQHRALMRVFGQR